MTNQTQMPAVVRTNRRSSKTPAWKSALLASAMGTMILGWGILGCTDATSNTETQQSTATSLASEIVTADDTGTTVDSSSQDSVTIPSLPQAPTFRQAPARTRGS